MAAFISNRLAINLCGGILFLFFILSVSPAQAWPWQWNKIDKNELRHGKWRTFHDADSKVVHFKGKYRHGKERGRWKTYSPEGKLYFKEKFKPKTNQVKTTYYHPNGKVSHRGMALQYETAQGNWNFYWQGEWEYFDAGGAFLGIKKYEKGNAASAQPVLPTSGQKE